MSLFVFFISLLIVAQHVSGNHVPIIRSWRLHDVIALCWYVPWLQEGGQDRLVGSASIGRTTYQPTNLQKLECIICSDSNVNFLINSSSARHLTLILQSYNLFHITDFPTRMTKISFSAVDNIFFDYTRINSFQVSSWLMGSLIMKLSISV